ncbi:MAG: hypothetical protein KJO69_02440, partial [Gammaproteobacteria bacterium]|nr:hypothetical protein [Gammaproteobacteria bacterium]
ITTVTVGSPTSFLATAHGLSDGQYVWLSEITGGTDIDLNGYYPITRTDANNFTIAVNTTGQAAYSNGRSLEMLNENIPSANGEWDEWQGVSGHSAALFIYAESDPATYYSNIYYVRWFSAPLIFYRTTGTIEISGINFRYCSMPFNLGLGAGSSSTAGALWMHDCVCNDNYYGIYATAPETGTQFWWDGLVIEDNHVYRSRATGIAGADYMKNSIIQRNLIHDVCRSYSDGGVYFGNCYAPVGSENKIQLNEIYNINEGLYWPTDGACILMDSKTAGIKIRSNFVYNSETGLGDNSSRNNVWSSNIVVNCDYGIKVSDSESGLARSMNLKYFNNTLVNCGADNYTNSELAGKNRAIRINCFAGDATAVVELGNNIIVGADISSTYGISVEQQFIAAGATYTEYNNCVYNCLYELVENLIDASSSLDSTDITVDPLLQPSTYKLLSGSPCRHAGKYVSGLKDKQLSPFSIPPNMGAYGNTSRTPARIGL